MFLVAPSACNCTPQYQSVSPRTEYEFKVRGRSETEFAAAFRVLRQLYGPIDSVGDTRRTSVYFDRGRRLEQRGIRLRTNRRHDANSMVLLKATARSSGLLRASREYVWKTGPEGLNLLDPVHRRLPVLAHALHAAFEPEERHDSVALATLVPVARVAVVRREFLVSSPDMRSLRLFNVLLDDVVTDVFESIDRGARVSRFLEFEVELDSEFGEAFDEALRLANALRDAGYELTTLDKCDPP